MSSKVRTVLRSRRARQAATVLCSFVPVAYVTATKILPQYPNAANLINYACMAFAIYWLADEEGA